MKLVFDSLKHQKIVNHKHPKKVRDKINKIKQVKDKQKQIELSQLQSILFKQTPTFPMKQPVTEVDSNDQSDPQQKTFHRILELYYNHNITTYANMFKKCLPDIDPNYENRMIRKNDKVWVEANLNKIFDRASFKLQKLFLVRNQSTKNTLDNYLTKFHNLPKDKIQQIQKSFEFQRQSTAKDPISKKNPSTLPIRNKSFSIQNVNSEPSCSQEQNRRTVSSKRVFRVREFKPHLNETMNNRYVQRLEKVKLQSSFAQFFFKKQVNPQEPKPVEIQKMYFDKIKAMTNIRWNYKPSENTHNLPKAVLPRHPPNINNNNYLGIQFRKQSLYKPKSKCNTRNSKVFLNF